VTLVLDAGALIAWERAGGDRRIAATWREGFDVRVPSVVVAQAWRDSTRQPALGLLLDAAIIDAVDDELARRAGELLARTGTSNAVDAIVACVAARHGATIVTSDPGDLQRLADDLGGVRVLSV
jgi:predicted nucleic acid-binding protein